MFYKYMDFQRYFDLQNIIIKLYKRKKYIIFYQVILNKFSLMLFLRTIFTKICIGSIDF